MAMCRQHLYDLPPPVSNRTESLGLQKNRNEWSVLQPYFANLIFSEVCVLFFLNKFHLQLYCRTGDPGPMMEMRGSHSGDPEEMPLKGPVSDADGPEESSLKTYVLNKYNLISYLKGVPPTSSQALRQEKLVQGSTSNIWRQSSDGCAKASRARGQPGVTGSSWRFSRGEEVGAEHWEQGRDLVEASRDLEPQIGVRSRATSNSSNKLRYQSEIRSLIQSCQDLDLSSDSEEDEKKEEEEEEEDSGMADTSTTSFSGGEQGVQKKKVNNLRPDSCQSRS